MTVALSLLAHARRTLSDARPYALVSLGRMI